MFFWLNAYAQRKTRLHGVNSANVDLFSFDCKYLFFRFFLHVYEN